MGFLIKDSKYISNDLHKLFQKDLKEGKVCGKSTLFWIEKEKENYDNYFENWLIDNGYADKECE